MFSLGLNAIFKADFLGILYGTIKMDFEGQLKKLLNWQSS